MPGMNQQMLPTSFWTGREASISQSPTSTPQQSQFMNMLLQQGSIQGIIFGSSTDV